jgi:hypothetical protein
MRLFPLIGFLIFLSCGASRNNENTLAQVGDEKLNLSTLAAQLPKGLNAADSASFSKAYIEQWIQAQVLKMEAEKNPVPADLDLKIERFKNQLLIQELREKVISERIGENQNTKKDSSEMGMSEDVILESKKWTIWQQYQSEILKKYEAEGLIKKP